MADGADFSEFSPAYGGGYNLGVDLGPPPDLYASLGNLTLPNLPDIQAPSFSDRALDFVGNIGSGLAKEFETSPLKAFSSALGLGATGLGIGNQFRTGAALNRQTRATEQAQKAAQAAAAPAVAFGQETLNAARAGKLPPPMESAIEQWKQQAKADMRARLASMGLGNSTDIQSEESKIDLMGESIKAQLLQSQEGVALQGLQTGVSAATGAGQMSQQQQALLMQLIEGANAQLGQLGARQ